MGEICQVCVLVILDVNADMLLSALSPTPPFPKDTARMRLAGVLVPAVAIALVTTSSMFMKMTTFFVGAGFFGDPVFWRALDLLNRNIPNWQQYLELRR